MNKGIIITLPRHDYVTEYLSQYSEEVINEAEIKNIKIKELENRKANRREFESVLRKLNYIMIVFNGHGSDETIAGYQDLPIVKVGVNDSLLKERIVYARSCNAAHTLGRQSMNENKGGCFIGYELSFMFYIDKNRISTPKKDKIAPLFLEPSNLVPISLIKGNTTAEAHERSKNQMLKNMVKILNKQDKESFLLAEALWNNYSGQVLLGNSAATL